MWRAGMKWMFLIIGTTIGAGYASGRELWQFFGHESGLAIVLFAVFFGISCTVIMSVSYRGQTTDYLPVLKNVIGPNLSGFYDIMILIYLFSITAVMIAGSGATAQVFNLPYFSGVFIIIFMLVVVFIRGINGLLAINHYIIPLLIGGLFYILLLFTIDQEVELITHWYEQGNWMAAFPFTALNILPLVAVLGAIGDKINSKQEIWIACIGSSFILGGISYIYNNSLIQIGEELLIYEIPLFAILKNYPFSMLVFMTILLWVAIFTTAASGVLGIVTRIDQYINKPLWVVVVGVLLAMTPLTIFGFSTLIKYLYPLYGVLNLYVLVRLLLYPVWGKVDIRKG